jgi:NAD(P)-dependent dehydrogenase (short-subunit alcohol dehydrogenase family)
MSPNDAKVGAMVRATIETYGRLDAAYNNAGVQNVLADTADTTGADYDRVMGINLRGIWSSMKFELQHMRKQRSRVIVNCSSLEVLSAVQNVVFIMQPSTACWDSPRVRHSNTRPEGYALTLYARV